MNEELTAEFQRKVSTMVDREVVYCVLSLMSEILPGMTDESEYIEEAQNLLYGRTYWVPWRDGKDGEEGEEFDTEEAAQEWVDNLLDDCPLNLYVCQIDERTREICEHWIVSPWLRTKLLEKGEIVEDIHNMDVWARTCTGQPIMLDGVICEIYRENNR